MVVVCVHAWPIRQAIFLAFYPEATFIIIITLLYESIFLRCIFVANFAAINKVLGSFRQFFKKIKTARAATISQQKESSSCCLSEINPTLRYLMQQNFMTRPAIMASVLGYSLKFYGSTNIFYGEIPQLLRGGTCVMRHDDGLWKNPLLETLCKLTHQHNGTFDPAAALLVTGIVCVCVSR